VSVWIAPSDLTMIFATIRLSGLLRRFSAVAL
jgi:hypothetical protein